MMFTSSKTEILLDDAFSFAIFEVEALTQEALNGLV